MTTLEDLLASHRLLARGLSDYEAECSCGGWESGGMWERLPTDFNAHVADQIRAHLLGETIIAEMAHVMASHRAQLGGWNTTGDAQHTARAALTAALDQGADQ